jgi:hypothetical protein
LAAVGAAAVTKLSLDQFGKGDLDRAFVALAYGGLVAFTLGAVLLATAVVWLARANRVTIGYLLEEGRIPRRLRTFFNENSYLLGGEENLAAFRARLTVLVKKPRPLASVDDRRELKRLLAARQTILQTGRSERTRIVSGWATVLIFVGALLATLGAATFALATNHDVVLREDRLTEEERARKEIVVGELVPKTPSSVLMVIPESARLRQPTNWGSILGKECQLGGVKAVLLEVARPPVSAVPKGNGTYVFHIVTERTDQCAVSDLWVPPTWVIPRPEETSTASSSGAGSTTSPATSSTTTATP